MRARSRGFSLLELLVALGILAGAMAVVIPALSTATSTEARSAAQTVAAALRRARGSAVTAGRSAAVEVDVEARSVRLGGVAERRLPEDLRLAVYTARSEISGEGRGAIRFFPDGSSTGGRVTVGSPRSVWLVDVDWLTGRVALAQGSEADWDHAPPGLVASGD